MSEMKMKTKYVLLVLNDRITVFDAYINQDSVNEHLDAFFRTVKPEDEVIMLSDLYGGSVNSVMYTYLTRPNTRLVAGVNLALVLELAVKEEISDEDLAALVEQSRTMLRIVELEKAQEEESNDEDFF